MDVKGQLNIGISDVSLNTIISFHFFFAFLLG